MSNPTLTEVEQALLEAVIGLTQTPVIAMLETTAEADGLAFIDKLFTEANATVDAMLASKFGSFGPLLEPFLNGELVSLEAKLKALVTAEVGKVIPAPAATPAPAAETPVNPADRPVNTVAGVPLR